MRRAAENGVEEEYVHAVLVFFPRAAAGEQLIRAEEAGRIDAFVELSPKHGGWERRSSAGGPISLCRATAPRFAQRAIAQYSPGRRKHWGRPRLTGRNRRFQVYSRAASGWLRFVESAFGSIALALLGGPLPFRGLLLSPECFGDSLPCGNGGGIAGDVTDEPFALGCLDHRRGQLPR